jgi:hypothetical protein
MSTSLRSRPFALGFAAGVLAACIALPVFADDATAVSFQANNPWTQEVGSVDRFHESRDYTVQVGAGKTLQVNLVTRDPNVFFKIRNETRDEQLVDTFQTGATTWSTQNTDAATYTIHVYVDPATMQRGEEAKYALQIGQYGAADMRSPTTTVTFQDNKPWVQAVGTLDSQASARDYAVAIGAGETLAVNLVTHNPKVYFKVENQASGQILVDSATSNNDKWSMPVDAAATFTVSVYADPAALPPGSRAGYALQFGHYVQNNLSPVAAGTAASPASATSAPVPAASAGSAG